jgi:hypothetical protein
MEEKKETPEDYNVRTGRDVQNIWRFMPVTARRVENGICGKSYHTMKQKP